MHPFPHRYEVTGKARPEGRVDLASAGLPTLESVAPKEFDGPGDRWSPETLLTAAIADCFILSFRAIATASKFSWTTLECHTQGELERVAGQSRFTKFNSHARLMLPAGSDPERAKKLLEKAEQVCLIANSLSAERHLETEVIVG
jgi:organic hydroperoxide reductase OsmC/OhrA